MKLPKYFMVYSNTKGRDFLIAGILFICSLLLGRAFVRRGLLVSAEFGYASLSVLIVMLLGAVYFWWRGTYVSSILFHPSGVQYKTGVIAYSQYSHLQASFAYQRISLVRKENDFNPISIRLPKGHQGRQTLYALSSATSIPVQEDYFSTSVRQPNGRIIADPRTDLQNEMNRQEENTNKGGDSLIVRRREDWIQITTPWIQYDKIFQNLFSLTMLFIGAYFFYVFFVELQVVDVFFRSLGLAISGSAFMTFLAVLAFGYPIFESITERIELTVTPEVLTLSTKKGINTTTHEFRLSNVIGITIQQVGWKDGIGLSMSKPLFDCLLLTNGDTIQMGISSARCHQWQGLLSTALEDLGYRNSY